MQYVGTIFSVALKIVRVVITGRARDRVRLFYRITQRCKIQSLSDEPAVVDKIPLGICELLFQSTNTVVGAMQVRSRESGFSLLLVRVRPFVVWLEF